MDKLNKLSKNVIHVLWGTVALGLTGQTTVYRVQNKQLMKKVEDMENGIFEVEPDYVNAKFDVKEGADRPLI